MHRLRGSGLATSLLAALALAATLLPATGADAVTVDGPLDGDPENTSVDIVGNNGRDQVVVRLIGADTLAVRDERGGVEARGDCQQAGPAEAHCKPSAPHRLSSACAAARTSFASTAAWSTTNTTRAGS